MSRSFGEQKEGYRVCPGDPESGGLMIGESLSSESMEEQRRTERILLAAVAVNPALLIRATRATLALSALDLR